MQNNQNQSEVVISDTQNTFTQENEQENSTELEASMKDLLEKLEQQLKLYAENLQQKLDDSEKTRAELLESSTNMIRDNIKLQSARNASASKDKNIGPNSNQLTSVNSQNLQQYKKLSMDIDYKNAQKSEQKSPIKDKKSLLSNFEQSSQRSTHNTSGNDYLKVKIEIGQKLKEKPDFKNSYQRFYNQVKQAKDDQIRQMNVYNRNKDLKSLYNSATASKNINMSHKDQKGLVVGQSYQGSHNGSFAQVQNQLNKNFSMTSSSLGKANKRRLQVQDQKPQSIDYTKQNNQDIQDQSYRENNVSYSNQFIKKNNMANQINNNQQQQKQQQFSDDQKDQCLNSQPNQKTHHPSLHNTHNPKIQAKTISIVNELQNNQNSNTQDNQNNNNDIIKNQNQNPTIKNNTQQLNLSNQKHTTNQTSYLKQQQQNMQQHQTYQSLGPTMNYIHNRNMSSAQGHR
ncbi:hypothetical protein PPERSA_06593 [Pseudocohnilembus persalinus]|uniref:Uncharacterized protein n=1 Tax=Pseudocohnilembus persalinus TaxID=266149 RepID=A0A0V0QRM5_PSEPJ|nr:hypothetical protein PPERSA_06593 [Pseudocohnilembus persalinus]|eukprot:KRX04959.1 hypothetical protein PPERSA_06593 [Pseudocohnilembus persalinus]